MKKDLSILRNKKFINLWASQLLSQFTINMLSFLILIRLFEQTKSSIATSMLWIFYTIPALLIGPFAAVLVDWIDKRKILMITNLLQAIVVAIYALSGEHRVVFFSYALVFLYSFLNQFYVPAEAATLPAIVSKKNLPQANGIFFITQQASLILGFGLAGVLVNVVGFQVSLVTSSLCLFFAFISVSFLPAYSSRKINLTEDLEKQISKFVTEIIDGYKFIKNNSNILSPFVLLLVLEVLLSVILVSTPIIATQIVGIQASLAGLLIITPAGIGAVFATTTTSQMLAKGTRKKKIINLSLISLSFVILALLPLTFLPSTLKVLASILIFAATGYFFVTTLIPTLTFLQEQTPGGLMGRVFGNFWFLTSLATILPVIFSGTIADIFGANSIIVILGLSFLTLFVISTKQLWNTHR